VQIRLAEIAALLALAQDGAFGQPTDSQLRGALLAYEIAERCDLDAATREALFWAAPLRYIGCTGHAHEVAVLFGDEIEFRARTLREDQANPAEVMRTVLSSAGAHRPAAARIATVLGVLAGGRKAAIYNFQTGCEVGDALAARLGIPDGARTALRFTFERWNGRGMPAGAKGEAIPLAMRVIHLAQDAEVLARVRGHDEARREVRKRSGRAYDPAIARPFLDHAPELLASLDAVDPWDAVLAHEPAPQRSLDEAGLEAVLEVLADFADLKSPWTGGHSRGVAALGEAAAASAGLNEADRVLVRRAGLVHDIGRVAVANSVWDKPGVLTRAERDRVQTHPMRTEQLLARSPGLAALVDVAGAHHERADGAGYHRRLPASALPPAARILAAADRYQAMTEPRAHRGAREPADAAHELREEARTGGLDPEAAECVLAAAGHRRAGRSAPYPDGLTAREVEVLRLVARGRTTRQIAAELVISAKTADRHVQNCYAKIGVSTRGAAALYAAERALV
jgi:HD-GYP domain-containing protein (c-di-GMP phosphodiesterase class II)